MNVIPSHTNIDSPPSLSNARTRSSSPYSPHSTPLPASSTSSYTSRSASDEQSITFSTSSPGIRGVGNGGQLTSQEAQGQNRDREGQVNNAEEPAAILATVATERSRSEETRGEDQQQVANPEALNSEAIDSNLRVMQPSASEMSGVTRSLGEAANSATSAPVILVQTQAPVSNDNNTSTVPESLEDFPALNPASHLSDSNNTNGNEVREEGQIGQVDGVGSTEQEAILQRHHETDEENEDSDAAANDNDNDDDDDDEEEEDDYNDEDDYADDGEGDDDQSGSSDEEGDSSNWRYLVRAEDTSSPDEEELKEIVEAGESSADDESYWESKMSEYLQDPEYVPGASGCLGWLIEGYNGTKDKPNRKLVMTSPRTGIGGYEWQINFYPRGHTTSYLSVYLECVNMLNEKKESRLSVNDEKSHEESDRCDKPVEDLNSLDKAKDDKAQSDTKPARQLIDTPIPYLQGVDLTKPLNVVALFTIVLYNPEEPRVNHHRTSVHRFSPGSPDWGWKRFHGPHKAIHMRQRGQRQALLLHDKLAFKAYIRLICDPTGCLGQHGGYYDNSWDSFTMTGIRSLTLKGYDVTPSDSHFVSALSSWLMLKPFRQFLYNLDMSNPYERPREKPKPFIVNLLKLLYFWRMPLKYKQRCISLGNTRNAIGWHGIDSYMESFDVVDVWMFFRTVLEIEMSGSPSPSPSSTFSSPSAHSPGMKRLGSLLGRRQSPATGILSHRIPVKGVQSIQEGIDRSEKFLAQEDPLPELLSVELERQVFNDATREWRKIVDKVDIQEKIRVRGVEYILYGMIVHEGGLRSGKYHAVLRPQGPGGKWYKFSSDDEGGKVTCLTRKEAVTAHEGFSPNVLGNSDAKADEMSAIAYIAMYIQSDVATAAFETEEEPWDVPNWLVELIEEDKRDEEIDDEDDNSGDEVVDSGDADGLPAGNTEDVEDSLPMIKAIKDKRVSEESPEELEVQIIDSRTFLSYESYGNFDPSDPRLATTARKDSSPYVHNIKLKSNATVEDITNILVDTIEDVECKRQCRFWAIDSYRKAYKTAAFMDPERSLKMKYLSERTERRFWVHVTPIKDLPPLPAVVIDNTKNGEGGDEMLLAARDERETRPANTEDVNRTSQQSMNLARQQVESRDPRGDTENTARVAVIDNLDENYASQQNQEGGPSPTITTILNFDFDAYLSPLPAPSRDVALNIGEATESQNIAAAQSGPAVIPGSHDDDHDATPQVPVLDDTNRQAISGQPRENNSAPVPSNNDANVQTISSNQTRDDVVQDSSIEPGEAPEDTYVFLKIFDQEAQKLIPWTSFMTPVTSRISAVIQDKLGLPDCETMGLWEEISCTALSLNRDHTFAEAGLDGAGEIIIYCKTLPEERIAALAQRAAFHEPAPYVYYLRILETFPDHVNGPITVSNFSYDCYRVNLKHNHAHGYGHRIYFSGAEYTGEYRLNVRHGLGRMIYANGDEYNGYWVDGVRHGQGRFVEAATGNTYVGEWRKDRQFGEGVTTWKVADVSERSCRICWNASADSAMYDCGHVVACLECARRVENCPVCRKRVISAMKLFYVT